MKMNKSLKVTFMAVVTAVMSAMGLITCCGFPLLVSLLAWVGIGTTQFEFFSEYQNIFIIFSFFSILYGFKLVYFRKKQESSCCTKRSRNTITKILLWCSLIGLVYLVGSKIQKPTASAENNCCSSTVPEN
ncbi:hypothetical protein K5X82_04065 [Halosquirtibacter xylanolyticus]|uniref:hypothetical protein n=1 Tax=Halosquirtibacter xylanolyticus TaxID=3374599 RepID=UPI0037492BB1|nr:hypothetical protein K5X82_04065 [Prolixibacteraceae bacterium]